MNKQITSILLCIVMMFAMLTTGVPALAAPTSTCTFTVEADKIEAHRGDTITFTVYLQQTGKQNTLEFTVVPLKGLTYVANSGTLAENISETMGFDEVAWTEQSMYCSGFGAYSYTGTEKIELLTFKCTVDADAEFKDYSFDLTDCWADDDNYQTKNAVVIPSAFSVVEKAEPESLPGDFNVDGKVSVKDIRMLAFAIANEDFNGISEQGIINGDVSYDGELSIKDIRKIAFALANNDYDSLKNLNT